MGFIHPGQVLKQALAELIGRGCRVESIAHDPPAIHYWMPEGARCSLVVHGDSVLIDRPDRPATFHSLRSALQAACQPLAQTVELLPARSA